MTTVFGNCQYGSTGWAPGDCVRIAMKTTATSPASPATIHGKIFALALRPRPNAVRRLCT